ncbi:anthranilate phosphoribosyltransferase [Metarhizium acridum]|nr:anthranilate phosphoribosyltransferase [Metarhizium acridum]
MASTPTPSGSGQPGLPPVDLKPLLTKLWPVNNEVTADEIADAISHFFTNQVTEAQTAALLMALSFHQVGFPSRRSAKRLRAVMLDAAEDIPVKELNEVLARRGRKEGAYNGGLCDIVGTGGDSHNTFNVSTTASILASSLLMVSKHGNRASTSKSGSADMINSMKPRAPVLSAVKPPAPSSRCIRPPTTASCLRPVFHTGMRYVAPIRNSCHSEPSYNNLGATANPALIVCGEEELDEISCGRRDSLLDAAERSLPGGRRLPLSVLTITPEDFGATRPTPSAKLSPGKEAAENGRTSCGQILCGEFPDNDPLIDFIAINTAALFVVSGICEADTSDMGHGE